MVINRHSFVRLVVAAALFPATVSAQPDTADHESHVHFSVRSVSNGPWSDPSTWNPARVPKPGDRVLISSRTTVNYDVNEKGVLRLVQVAGTLSFARDRNTELNVGLLTIQHSDTCSEHGFACEFEGAEAGPVTPSEHWPSLIVGTSDAPIPAEHTARIRLHYVEGMDKKNAPAIACCSGRMELHGAPMSRTWMKLGADVAEGSNQVTLSGDVSGWRVGDEIIVTATDRASGGSASFRQASDNAKEPQTERRTIAAMEGTVLTLDRPLRYAHSGRGEFRGEVANLSRNVVVESADPNGVRGHTVYHRFSRGGISYARFAHLGKEGVLGRYAIHYHLVGDTMRGSSVLGAAVVDSHNRWVTIHGTQYLLVRDCIGYGSVGHGYFLEDGTEVYNLLDRNLAVHACRGRRLPDQALPFDPNDGAGFWWANGLNTITRNVTTENDEYGYRYDMQKRSNFDTHLPILQPDGSEKVIDVRTIPIWRFEKNEARAEGFYGMVVAANGNSQPDSGIRSEGSLQRIMNIDWTGPDTEHPHIIRDLKIHGAHYAFRPHSPSMLIENLRIDKSVYGIYRPCFENHVYRNVHLSGQGPEPFNRGMDDASAQVGSITVDGLRIDSLENGNQRHPFIHMTDNGLAEGASCHFRNIVLDSRDGRRPLFNLGGSSLVEPFVDRGVPYFVHDFYGAGRDAKIVSVRAKHLINDGNSYREDRPITGDESRIAEVANVTWPQLLNPVDDIPPATIITSVRRDGQRIHVRGVSHDNGEITSVRVNGQTIRPKSSDAGIVDWSTTIESTTVEAVIAFATDAAGNCEQTVHRKGVADILPVVQN